VVLGIEIYIIHDHTFIISLLFTIHDKIIMLIGTWRTTRENSATTRVVWDALGLLIRKASGGLPYPKGARAVGEWSM
jgi:predicted ferric reductase